MAATAEPRLSMEALGAALLTTARELVERNGGVYPFGGHSTGGLDDPDLVTPTGEGAFPLADRLHAEVVAQLAAAVEAGAVVTAVCTDVVIRPPGEDRTDALRVLVEHPQSHPLALYLPYRRERDGYRFGELIATPGDPLVRASGPAA